MHVHIKKGYCTCASIDAMKVAAAVLTLTAEKLQVFANYTSSKGVSTETVETPLDLPLLSGLFTYPCISKILSKGSR